MYIYSGSGVFEVEKVGKVTIEPGSVFLLFPDIWHTYSPAFGQGWEEYWVGFTGVYAEYLMQHECFNPDNPLIHMGVQHGVPEYFHLPHIAIMKAKEKAFTAMVLCLTIQLLGLVYTTKCK